MFLKRLLLVLALLTLVLMALPIATVSPIAVQAVRAADPIAVFGAYATPLEEPWPNVIHQALLGAQKKGLITYEHTDNIGYAGDMEKVLRDVAEKKKPKLIIGDGFGNEEAIRAVAADYPDIAFAFGSELGPSNPNLSVFDNWIHEPAYLCGLIAGGLTKSNVIGVVAAMPIPEVNRLVNAFQQGALETNPKVQVRVTYINSFFDPATAKDAALAQIDAGADVLYAERFGVIEAAASRKVYVFGNMADQSSLAPEWVITGPVWSMEPTVDYLLKQITAGSYTALDLKDFSMMAKGGSSLAPLRDFETKLPKDLVDKVKKRQDEILKGKFRVEINEKAPGGSVVATKSAAPAATPAATKAS
jgi:basic membrane lipoprotein Med (substrate-binding protein (PBP1-ABC) superfamily)